MQAGRAELFLRSPSVHLCFYLPLSTFRRNKHGCEMCRCVKCPPFTCDKHCSDGYRQNKKGCSVCMCKGKA